MKFSRIVTTMLLIMLLSVIAFALSQETRGVGIYPRNPDEDYAPTMVPA